MLILIKITIIIGCTSALLIQGRKCFERYFNYETTAILSVRPTGNAPFLSFTICPDYDTSYNPEKLKKYNIDRLQYQRGSYNHSGPDRSPRQLFEEVTYKLEEIIKFARVSTWDEYNSTIVIPVDGTLDPKLGRWVKKIHILYGYCYSLEIFSALSAFGISELAMESYVDIFIMLHHSGQFLDYNTKSKVKMEVSAHIFCDVDRWNLNKYFQIGGNIKEYLFIDLTYEVTIDTLESESELACNPNMNEHLDECLYRGIDKNLTDSFGCTIPYLPNYPDRDSEVCREESEAAVKAVDRYYTLRDHGQRQMCSRPCSAIEVFSGQQQTH